MSAIFETAANNVTATGSAGSVNLGYTPTSVEVTNRTSGVKTIKRSNYASNTTQLIAQNGNLSYDTNSLITLSESGFSYAAGVANNGEILDYFVTR